MNEVKRIYRSDNTAYPLHIPGKPREQFSAYYRPIVTLKALLLSHGKAIIVVVSWRNVGIDGGEIEQFVFSHLDTSTTVYFQPFFVL
jgi:hypothetical protein